MRTSLEVEVSNRQLGEYESWGLIERIDGIWLADTEWRLGKIREAALGARSLPRRVLNLYAFVPGFPVAAGSFRRALIETAPTIARPVRKLVLVARARAAMQSVTAANRVRPGTLPRHDEWTPLLSEATEATVAQFQIAWTAQARDVMPTYGKRIGIDLYQVPVEERVVMVAVLDLALPRLGPGPPTIEP